MCAPTNLSVGTQLVLVFREPLFLDREPVVVHAGIIDICATGRFGSEPEVDFERALGCITASLESWAFPQRS